MSGNRQERAGKVQTVLGLINPDQLGITLSHEHLLVDGTMYFIAPTPAGDRCRAYEPVSLDNLHWVLHHRDNSYDNCFINDEKLATKELMLFSNAGGSTICDLTPQNLGRDPEAIARISRATGVNIIMGTAYYQGTTYYEKEIVKGSEEDIAQEFVRDILEGAGFFKIRAGIIGEIGCTWPLKENQRKVLAQP